MSGSSVRCLSLCFLRTVSGLFVFVGIVGIVVSSRQAAHAELLAAVHKKPAATVLGEALGQLDALKEVLNADEYKARRKALMDHFDKASAKQF